MNHKYAYAYGIKDGTSFISYILFFDYDNIYKTNPDDLKRLFIPEKDISLGFSLFSNTQQTNNLWDKIHRTAMLYGSYLLYLLSIGVKKEYRNRGFASQLIRFATDRHPNYYIMTDVSNPILLSLLEKEREKCFLLQELEEHYSLAILHPPIKLSKNPPANNISLVIPTLDVLRKVFPDCNKSYISTVVQGYSTVTSHGFDDFIFEPESKTEALIIQVTYQDLLTYQRYINLSICKESILENKVVIYHRTEERKDSPVYNDTLKKMLVTRQEEWNIIPDIYISFPVEYSDITILEKKSKENYDKTISHLLESLNYRTYYESGVPKKEDLKIKNASSNSFKDRICRYYLGKISVHVLEETTYETYIDGGDKIGQPASIDLIISVDTMSKIGVISLVSLSAPFLLSHFLDNIIRNQLTVAHDNKDLNLYEYMELEFSLIRRGSPKAFINIPADRHWLDDKILSSLLFLETIYDPEEGMGCVVDKDITSILGNKNGIAQYQYASVYTYSNSVIQISRLFEGTVFNRILTEVITFFYIELLLFEEAAICSTNEKIVGFLSSKQAKSPIKTLKQIQRIHNEYSKTIEFWDIEVNYPSSKKSLQEIRNAFQLENKIERLNRNQEQLQLVFKTERDILDRVEASILNYMVLTLTLFQLVNFIFPSILAGDVGENSKKSFLIFIVIVLIALYANFQRAISSRKPPFDRK
jgi:GNAT superfamily N-acetyltransferase